MTTNQESIAFLIGMLVPAPWIFVAYMWYFEIGFFWNRRKK